MKSTVMAFVAILLSAACYAQPNEEKEIVKEGKKLYQTEMASWYGTDLFLEKFSDRKENTGGYFSYLRNDKAVCVFFSKASKPKIIGTFAFDSTYNVNTVLVDGLERELTEEETDFMTIRQAALAEYKKDTALFKRFDNTNPNFIPLNDEKGKRVYVLTGPQQQGVVLFGNDYLLTFTKKNQLDEKKRLHRNLIPIAYGKKDGKVVLATIHSHLSETGDLITATDICTLLLYEKYAGWGQHIVMSENNVSLWDCKKDQLAVMTRKAWEKINEDQKERNKNRK